MFTPMYVTHTLQLKCSILLLMYNCFIDSYSLYSASVLIRLVSMIHFISKAMPTNIPTTVAIYKYCRTCLTNYMGPYYATSCHWLLTASGIDTQIHMPTSLAIQTKYTLATIPGLSKFYYLAIAIYGR